MVDLDKVHAANAADVLSRTPYAVFLQATYGDGEPTDGAAAFCKWVAECSSSGGEPLKALSVAVFGLGNKQYEHFNAAAKKLDAGLVAAGARRVCALGLGDDDASLEDDFAQWKAQNLWPGLEKAAPSIAGTQQEVALRRASEDGPGGVGGGAPKAYEVTIHSANSPVPTPPSTPVTQRGSGVVAAAMHWDAKHPFQARLVTRKELHTGGDRSCLHCELDLKGGPAYDTGDHIGILGENSPGVVAQLLQLLGQRGDVTFSLSRKRTSLDAGAGEDDLLAEPFPGPVRLDAALARFADVLTPPKRSVFAVLASLAATHDVAHASKLAHLASPGGKDAYAAYVTQTHRSLVEVLADYPTLAKHIPLGVFFASISPRLAPRYYSISSGAGPHPHLVHITAAVVRGLSPSGRMHEGVCTTWLARLPLGAPVPVFIRSSGFRLPKQVPGAAGVPILMVGPGTGVAPFRAFIQERGHVARTSGGAAALGPATLFFGCRAPDVDYLYREELEGAATGPALNTLHVAFSRQAGQAKTYVQHDLAAHGEAVYEALVSCGGHLYVCGDAKAMAKDVHKATVELLQRHGRMTAPQAEAYMARMHTEGRYLRDVW